MHIRQNGYGGVPEWCTHRPCGNRYHTFICHKYHSKHICNNLDCLDKTGVHPPCGYRHHNFICTNHVKHPNQCQWRIVAGCFFKHPSGNKPKTKKQGCYMSLFIYHSHTWLFLCLCACHCACHISESYIWLPMFIAYITALPHRANGRSVYVGTVSLPSPSLSIICSTLSPLLLHRSIYFALFCLSQIPSPSILEIVTQ